MPQEETKQPPPAPAATIEPTPGPSPASQAPPVAEPPTPKEGTLPAKPQQLSTIQSVQRREKPSKPFPQKIKYTVSNLNSIAQTARNSKDFNAGPTPVESKPIGTYYDSLDIKRKLITDKRTYFTIDVQPDMRFFTYYSAFTTVQAHPKLVTDNYPYVSIPSLIGYKLALLTADLLIIDMHARRVKSMYSTPFQDNATLKSILSLLMSCRIPSDTVIPLEQLAPTRFRVHPLDGLL